ncbi:MAG: diacylglycerol kinase family protein [Pirellulaceae bacterium]
MSKTVVVMNATAGMAGDRREELDRLAQYYGFPLQVPMESSDLSTMVRSLAAEAPSRILVAGGDGTVAQVANAILPDYPQIELAIIPLGTGNDLARSLDIPLDDMQLAFDIAATHAATPIDVMLVEHGKVRYCLNAATGGLGAEVTASLGAANKQLWGAFAYWFTAVGKLADLHAFEIDLVIDTEPTHHRVFGLCVANGRYIGGGFPIAAQAKLDDGWMDVLIVPEMPSLDLLGAGMNFMLSGASERSGVTVQRAQRIEIQSRPPLPFSLDGEASVAFNAVFEIIPKYLACVAGSSPEGVES